MHIPQISAQLQSATPPLQDLHRPSILAQLQCTYNCDTNLSRRTNQPLLLCKICTFDQFLTNQSAQAHPASASEFTHWSLSPDEDALVASKGLGKWVINPLDFTFNTQKRSLPLHICKCFMHTQMFYVYKHETGIHQWATLPRRYVILRNTITTSYIHTYILQ